MRILMLSEFYPPLVGGLELHVQALAGAMAARGHEVHVATLEVGPVEAAGPAEEIEGGVHVHRLRSLAARIPGIHGDPRRPFLPPSGDPLVRRGLSRLIGEVRPDVVHAHNWMASSLPRQRPPLVMTSHDYARVCPKRNLLRPDGSRCSGPRLDVCLPCAAHQYGAVRAAAIELGTRVARHRLAPEAEVVVSSAVGTVLAPFVTTPPVVIPNFVADDFSELPDVEVPGLPEAPFALFAGAALPHKGIDVLLAAWAEKPIPCPLVLAALDPGTRSWPDGTTVVSLSRIELASALRRAGLLVVPSLWADPCPTVVLEALISGVPVVASAVGGIPELVRQGVDGVLVAPGDPAALRAAVVALLADGPRRAQMATSARARGREFTVSLVAARVEALYRSVVAGEPRGHEVPIDIDGRTVVP